MPKSDSNSGANYSPEELAALLSKAGLGDIDPDCVRLDIAAGAPVDADGKLHPLHYAAWLNERTNRKVMDGRSAQAQAG